MAVGRLFSFAETVPGHEERKREACGSHKLEYVHWHALLSSDSLAGFYLNGGSQSLRRGLTAYHSMAAPERIVLFAQAFFKCCTFQLFQCFQHLFGVVFRLYFSEYLYDNIIPVNGISRPLDPHHRTPEQPLSLLFVARSDEELDHA